VRVACCQLLQVLGLPNNVSIALGGSQIIQDSTILGMYPQVMYYVISLRSNLLMLVRIGYSYRHTAGIREGHALPAPASVWLIT
jgi:hypothetical protein